MGPLKGIKVIDMTTVLMGPYATQMLGDYGADVIKIESLDGDVTRQIGPTRHPGMGPVFLNTNRSKRSICLDLKKPAGRDAVLRLIKTADVLVYNVRPQAMARLQLGYDVVAKVNPRLIYAGVFGFGQDGPYAAKPAYDDLIQGATALPALMAQTGDGVPRYVPNALVDRIVGSHRGRRDLRQPRASRPHRARPARRYSRCSRPWRVLSWATTWAGSPTSRRSTRAATRGICRATGGPTRPPTAISASSSTTTSSGRISSTPPAATICAAIRNLRPLPAAPTISTWSMPSLRASSRRATTAEWTELLDKADVPVMPMHDLESILQDPHLVATDFFPVVDHPTEGQIRSMKVSATWSETPVEPTRLAPRLSEHSAEILREAGFSADEIAALVRDGVTKAAAEQKD